jgi:rubrerythrin
MKAHTFWLVLLCAVWPTTGFTQKSTAPQKTIDNLNTAVAGEANASHRYTLFAQKADQEGYAQVAKLFRAAALAESTHEKNHEGVLRGLGIEPKQPVLEKVKVGTTRDNLEVPIKGEANEADTMYPSFIEEARRQNVPAAVKSFTYALDTEAEHEKLFKDALEHLGHNVPADYYVGRVSGDTVTAPTTREPYTKIE